MNISRNGTKYIAKDNSTPCC